MQNKQLVCTYDNCNKRLLKLLVKHLSADIYAWEPAAVSRMTVVPSDGILQAAHLNKFTKKMHIHWTK